MHDLPCQPHCRCFAVKNTKGFYHGDHHVQEILARVPKPIRTYKPSNSEAPHISSVRSPKVIFIKMRQNHNFETWRIEGECFQESLIIALNSTSSHSHLRQR